GASGGPRDAEEVPCPAVPRGEPEDPPGDLRGLQVLPGGLPRCRRPAASRRARGRLSAGELPAGRALGGGIERGALRSALSLSLLGLSRSRGRGEVYLVHAAERPAMTQSCHLWSA